MSDVPESGEKSVLRASLVNSLIGKVHHEAHIHDLENDIGHPERLQKMILVIYTGESTGDEIFPLVAIHWVAIHRVAIHRWRSTGGDPPGGDPRVAITGEDHRWWSPRWRP